MNKRGHIKIANSASCGDFSHLHKARFLDEPYVLSALLASHKCENSSTIPEFAFCKNAESALDSVNSQNLIKKFNKKSLSKFLLLFAFAKSRVPLNFTDSNLPNKADSQNLQSGLPRRFCESARNDKFLDSSLRLRFAQNDNLRYFTESANKAQQTIEEIAVEVAEFLGDFQGNFVLSDKARLKSAQCSKFPKSPQDAPKTKLQTQDELT